MHLGNEKGSSQQLLEALILAPRRGLMSLLFDFLEDSERHGVYSVDPAQNKVLWDIQDDRLSLLLTIEPKT